MTKGKIFLLFSGGIIAGGTIVAVVMNQWLDKPEKIEKKEVVNEAEHEKEIEIKTKNIPLDSTGNYLDKKLPIAIKGDTNTDYYSHIDKNSDSYDSLLAIKNGSEVTINRDRMVASDKVKVKIFANDKLSAEDSLLNKLNNIKNSGKSQQIDVEFWESPIHYKGYKLGRNKLVLFGIDNESKIMLFDLNDYVILQSGESYYRLERTADFKNLRRFTNEAVIQQLGK